MHNSICYMLLAPLGLLERMLRTLKGVAICSAAALALERMETVCCQCMLLLVPRAS
jgi:hypothetical protein